MPNKGSWANLGSNQHDGTHISFQKRDRNTLVKPPEESNQDLSQDHALASGDLQRDVDLEVPKEKYEEFVDQNYPLDSKFLTGNNQFSKLEIGLMSGFGCRVNGTPVVENSAMSELMANLFCSIDIGMNTLRKSAMCLFGNSGAYQLFVKMLDRGFSCGNVTFDPGITDISLPKWSSSVLVLHLKGGQMNIVNSCCSCTFSVNLYYPSSIKWAGELVSAFKFNGSMMNSDPAGVFALYATGSTLNSSKKYESVESLNVFRGFFKCLDPGGND